MATIFIPTSLRSLTGGTKQVTILVSNIRQAVELLDQMYPGVKTHLMEDGQIRPDISVVIDGESGPLGILEKVGKNSEVHFIPAIGGG